MRCIPRVSRPLIGLFMFSDTTGHLVSSVHVLFLFRDTPNVPRYPGRSISGSLFLFSIAVTLQMIDYIRILDIFEIVNT